MIDTFKFLKKSIKFELIYTNLKGEKYSFESEILEVLDDKILITYPFSHTFDFNFIEIFEKLNTIAYTVDGVLSSNVNYLEKADNGIFISFPYNNQFCQRRENARIPMHIDFELTSVNNSNSIFNSTTLKSKNISGKGLACITTEALPDFENARIVMHFPDNDIEAFCRKVYSKEMLMNDDKVFINGIAFTEISKEDIKLIVKNCMKFEIISKHNERLFETL